MLRSVPRDLVSLVWRHGYRGGVAGHWLVATLYRSLLICFTRLCGGNTVSSWRFNSEDRTATNRRGRFRILNASISHCLSSLASSCTYLRLFFHSILHVFQDRTRHCIIRVEKQKFLTFFIHAERGRTSRLFPVAKSWNFFRYSIRIATVKEKQLFQTNLDASHKSISKSDNKTQFSLNQEQAE